MSSDMMPTKRLVQVPHGKIVPRSMLFFEPLVSSVENLALAISKLEYRERLLYTSFREDGVPHPHLPGLREMNHSQQMALFNHLDRLGVFDEFSEWMSSEMLQNIEIWRLLRWEGKGYQMVSDAEGRRTGNWFSFQAYMRLLMSEVDRARRNRQSDVLWFIAVLRFLGSILPTRSEFEKCYNLLRDLQP